MMAMKKFEMLNLICNNCSLTSKEVLVAHYFVYKSNQSGVCYPSVNTIAKHCSVSERSVQRATKKLQERGYIMISKRDINGKQTSNEYKLILESIKATVSNIKEDEMETVTAVPEDIPMTVISFEDFLANDNARGAADEAVPFDMFILGNEDIKGNDYQDIQAYDRQDELSFPAAENIFMEATDHVINSKNRTERDIVSICRINIAIAAMRWLSFRSRNNGGYQAYMTCNYRLISVVLYARCRLILYSHGEYSILIFLFGPGVPP